MSGSSGMEISTISSLKKDYNYETYPILDTRGLREKLHKLLPPLKHKELPRDIIFQTMFGTIRM